MSAARAVAAGCGRYRAGAPGAWRVGRGGALGLLAGLLLASTAAAQPLRPLLDPQALDVPRRAPLTLTPSLTISEEFDDNILLNNDDKRWDLITSFTPGITLEAERATYRVAAGYSFTADLYARHETLNRAFDHQNFYLDLLYRATPRLTLTLSDTLTYSTGTNLISPDGVSVGRDQAWSNGLSGSLAYALDPRTTAHLGGAWTVQRYDRDELVDSDAYRADVGLERALTARFTAGLGYQFGAFHFDQDPDITTHTPALSLRYRLSETLTAAVRGGPTFELNGETHVTPAVTAALTQRFAWGSASVDFVQAVGTAGGLGGTTVNRSAGLFVQVLTLARGLVVDAGPRYAMIESRDDRIDVNGFTIPVRAVYQFTPWLALVAAYRFFHQRSDSTLTTPTGTALATDVDQNRVSLGLRVGWPIRFD